MTKTKTAAKRGNGSTKKPATTQGKSRARSVTTHPPSQPQSNSTEGLDGAMSALALALDKKALEPVLLDVRQLCSFCNYQLIVSGRSDRQVEAIADGIEAGLKQHGLRPLSAEGTRSGLWALLDYGDFVVHVFQHPARAHYDLEGLWNDAPRVPIDVPAEARLPTGELYEAEAHNEAAR
jgi:ribosome-associated protein